MKTDNKHGM